jgi:hypothetical protein
MTTDEYLVALRIREFCTLVGKAVHLSLYSEYDTVMFVIHIHCGTFDHLYKVCVAHNHLRRSCCATVIFCC